VLVLVVSTRIGLQADKLQRARCAHVPISNA